MSFENIIAQVKAHPELWLPSHPLYRNRGKVKEVWETISVNLDSDEADIKKRWKHLKDHYRKEVKKVLSNQIPRSYWQHYNDMSFVSSDILLGMNCAKPRVGDSDGTSDSEAGSDQPLSVAKKIKTDNPLSDVRQPTAISVKKLQAAKKYANQTPIRSTLREIKNLVVRKNQSVDQELRQQNDPDYLFLMSLLPTMRSLTQVQKLQFRGRVNEWLLETVSSNEYVNQCDDKVSIQEHLVNTMPCSFSNT